LAVKTVDSRAALTACRWVVHSAASMAVWKVVKLVGCSVA